MSDSKLYWVCSNPECTFNKLATNEDTGCPLCGHERFFTCPHCSSELEPAPIMEKGDFCPRCRKRFKPAPAPKKKAKAKGA